MESRWPLRCVEPEPTDPDHLKCGSFTIGEEGVGSIVHGVDVEEVEDPSIQIGMLFIIREHHDIRVPALVNPVPVLLHVVCGICKFKCLVAIEGIGHNRDVAPVVIGKLPIGCDIWVWL